VVVGSGAPTAGLVYKLVEVAGRPVAKRSEHKATNGGGKVALRAHRPSGTATHEMVVAGRAPARDAVVASMQRDDPSLRRLDVALVVDGTPTAAAAPGLAAGRELLRASLRSLPWEGLSLSRGEPALPTNITTVA